ncbi:unnamed protein product [Urochloa humidicola]
MMTLCNLLFSNTDSFIRIDDCVWTLNVDAIGNINWCKVVVDNLRKAGRLYRVDKAEKGLNAPISGCGIFLIILYLDRLQHPAIVDAVTTSRCAFFDSKTIDIISAADRRGDVPVGVVDYGNLQLKSIAGTCYEPLPAAAAQPLAVGPTTGASGGLPPTDGAATGTSGDAAAPSCRNIDTPVLFNYPSFFSSFGPSLIDLVGRGKDKEAEKILKSYDSSAAEAQEMMRKAHALTRAADDLMAKAQHQCHVGIKKLLDDARSDKNAANVVRRNKVLGQFRRE